MNEKIINLKTGEVLECDPYQLREHGLPDDFVLVDDVSSDEWITALQNTPLDIR